MTRALFLCGAGNPEGVRLALRVNAREPRFDTVVLLDDDPARRGTTLLDVPIAGPFELLAEADPRTCAVVNLVARTTARRRAAEQRIARFGVPFTSLIGAGIDLLGVRVGAGVTVYEGAVLSANSVVGDASVVFTGAVVGHGCHVGRGCVIAPGAVLNARVKLADEVYVGTNASVLPDLTLADRVTVGSNSAVMEDVPADASVIGVPGEILRIPAGTVAATPWVADHEPGRHDRATLERELEGTLAGIWQDALHLPRVAAQDNIFDLGGNSSLALKVCATIREVTRLDLALVDVFRYPTVRALARHLAERSMPAAAAEPVETAAIRLGRERAAIRRRFH